MTGLGGRLAGMRTLTPLPVARLFGALIAALVLAAALFMAPGASGAAASSGTLVKTNCSPVAAGGGVMAYNTRQANGLWDVRVGDAACNGSAPLPAYDGHRGASDLSADGRLLLLTTAYGPMRSSDFAEPGKGLGNDLELLDRQTGTLRRLTTGRQGIIWAKFKSDLSKVTWAELVAGGGWFPWEADYLASWALHVADLNATTGTLTNERVWTPPTHSFVETYGWLPGTSRIIFDSDYGIGAQEGGGWAGHWYASQLQTIPEDLTTAPTRFSPLVPITTTSWDWGCWCNKTTTRQANVYHEFAHFNGDGRVYTSIVYGTEVSGAMDVWSYNAAGGDRMRLSYFGGTSNTTSSPATIRRLEALTRRNVPTRLRRRVRHRLPRAHRPMRVLKAAVPGWPAPRYAVVGGMAWTGASWMAGVAGDAQAKTIDAYRIVP
jgi:hypothetical protein